jgi:oligopeptidase B
LVLSFLFCSRLKYVHSLNFFLINRREEVLLDENSESRGHSFYQTAGVTPSPNHRLLAYTVDTVGGEKFTLYVKDLETGECVYGVRWLYGDGKYSAVSHDLIRIHATCYLSLVLTFRLPYFCVPLCCPRTSGKLVLQRPVENTAGDVEWAADSRTLFYVTKDHLDRPYKVRGGCPCFFFPSSLLQAVSDI